MKAALTWIGTGLFIVLALWYTYSDEYSLFHDQQRTYQQQVSHLHDRLQSFDPRQINLPQVDVHMTPDLRLLDQLAAQIDTAQERVWVQVYIFTEKRLRQALIDAHARGVDVRVALEPHVYGAPTINDTSYTTFAENGIEVVWTSDELYTFTHSKFILIDDDFWINTGNLSYSSFKDNREFFVHGTDEVIVGELEDLWSADADHIPYTSVLDSLVLSPESSRAKIVSLLMSAHTSILMYAQSIDDPQIKEILKLKKSEGVDIHIYMGNIEKYPANEDDIAELRESGIEIETPAKPYIHAKTLFIDETIGYSGSINFTTNSMDNNREVGIIFSIK